MSPENDQVSIQLIKTLEERDDTQELKQEAIIQEAVEIPTIIITDPEGRIHQVDNDLTDPAGKYYSFYSVANKQHCECYMQSHGLQQLIIGTAPSTMIPPVRSFHSRDSLSLSHN